MNNRIKKTAWADANINDDFIYITTYSGYGLSQYDPLGVEHFSEIDADNFTLGNMVLDALAHSRFVLPEPEKRKGIWVHPEVTYDADLFDYKQTEQRYKQWVEKLMNKFSYKTKKELFKKMKKCDIVFSENLMTIYPTRHQKLEAWGSDVSDNLEPVVIPGSSTQEEVGAALRLAFSRCID